MFTSREVITSPQNKYVSLARGLTNKKNREKEQKFRFDGVKLMCEALKKGVCISFILASDKEWSSVLEKAEKLYGIKENDINCPVISVEGGLFDARLALCKKAVARLGGGVLDDFLDAHLYNYVTVAVMLIVYGVAFILVERRANSSPKIADVGGISYKTALLIGAFQMLSLIPGTSRSGATILGAILIGLSRTAAAEFSFFMAIPTMVGASLIRGLKFVKFVFEGDVSVPAEAWIILAVGTAVAFVVSMAAIKFLTDFVKKHSFSAFGVYRIILGALVLLYFFVK